MSESAMTVANEEGPQMAEPEKIAQKPSDQPELANNADDRANGLTGCCDAEKPREIPAGCLSAPNKAVDCRAETMAGGQNYEPRRSDSEVPSKMEMQSENALLISETDDAKRESRDRNSLNKCNSPNGDSSMLNGQNIRVNDDGPSRCDKQSSLVLSLDDQTQNAETAKCRSLLRKSTDETVDANCVFDENESLKEQLNSVELKRRGRCATGHKLIITCDPYVPKDFPSPSNSRSSNDDAYDPEEELNFHEAVRAGDAKSVEKIIAARRSLNLDEPDWNVSGDPPLLVAATNHCLPVLRVLLENGCDPAVRSPRGETALHRAIINGGPGTVLKLVGELLENGCPAAVKEAGGGLTALHVLTRQLAHAQGSKSLHHDFQAALETLEILAKAGPVNARDHQGRSALHILASSTVFDNNHRTEIDSLIKILLDAGAEPSLKNDRGETPLHESLECGALNTAFLLTPHTPVGITSRYGETPLHIASRKNYIEMVTRLLEHGEDPSLQDAGGNTPLHLASARGFHQTVSLLVTSPLAQLERTNAEGLTALQVAAESGFVNAVRLLLKAGADPSQTVPYCTTTLHRHPDISVLIDHELTRRRQLAA